MLELTMRMRVTCLCEVLRESEQTSRSPPSVPWTSHLSTCFPPLCSWGVTPEAVFAVPGAAEVHAWNSVHFKVGPV